MSQEQGWEALLKIADGLEPEARQRFLEAIAALRDGVDVEALADALIRRQPITAQQLISDPNLAAQLEPLLDTMQKVFIASGQLTAAEMASLVSVPLRFDLVNPAAIDVAQRTAAALVQSVTTETQQALRSIIAQSFADGLTRREASALIRPLIGLTERQAIAAIRYREQLLAEGINDLRVTELTNRYAGKLLRQRASTIARTEIMTAANRGRDAMWQQAADRKLIDGTIERKWLITPDDRLCKFCLAMKNQIQPLGQAFTSPLTGRHVRNPPLHPNCRCVLRLVIRRLKIAA